MISNRVDSIAVAASRWLFRAQRPTWLTILRIGLGIQLLLYTWSLRCDWSQLIDPETRRISEAILGAQSAFVPRLGWLVWLGGEFGQSGSLVLSATWWVLLLLGVLLIAGVFCRAAAVGAWLLYLATARSTGVFNYGADGFTIIGLFYLAVSPLPDAFSPDTIWRKRLPSPILVGFFRRIFQLHLCLIYFFSGLTKALGDGWWNGRNLWIALARPPFDVLDPSWLGSFHDLFPIGGIAVVVLELSYPFLIGWRKTRAIWLGAILSMHIAIGVLMAMPLFASIMIILNLSGFGAEFLEKKATAS